MWLVYFYGLYDSTSEGQLLDEPGSGTLRLYNQQIDYTKYIINCR